ncbi:MAG TPA: TIGR04222 domain-containing membrane protein [Micromonosporaceae bacterium]
MDQPAQSRSEIADQLRPVEVAYLGGGAKAAVMAAVAGLHARKAVAVLRNRRLVATGIDPTTRAMAVEYAVLRAVREPTTLGSLRSAAGVREELRKIDSRLRTLGLLSSARRRWLSWLVRRTDAGESVMAELRRKYEDLDPAKHLAWRPREPHRAAMSVALFGPGAMPPASSGEGGYGRRTAVDGSADGGAG